MKVKKNKISNEENIYLDNLLNDLEKKVGVKVNHEFENLKKLEIQVEPKEKYILFLNDEFFISTSLKGDRINYGNTISSVFSDETYILGEFKAQSGKNLMGYFKESDEGYKIRPFNFNLYFKADMKNIEFTPKYVVSSKKIGGHRISTIIAFEDIGKVYPLNMS